MDINTLKAILDDSVDLEIYRLQMEKDEIRYRTANWGMQAGDVDYWNSIIAKMDARITALKAGKK